MDYTGNPQTAAVQEPSDGRLLAAYAERRHEAGYRALVMRHGPLVYNVCRRILGNDHDAEDAAQSVFLILAAKAGSLENSNTVAAWLHHVSRCVALNARERREVRGRYEREAAERLREVAAPRGAADRLESLLDGAIDDLPERYRLPLILCCLQDHSIGEAARRLGCSPGAVAMRLTRGRELLRKRLARFGTVVSAGALAAWLSGAAAPLPAGFAGAAAQAATGAASGALGGVAAGAGSVAPGVLAAAREGLAALAAAKLKGAIAVAVGLGVAVPAAGIAISYAVRPPAAESRHVTPPDRPALPLVEMAKTPTPPDAGARPADAKALDQDLVAGRLGFRTLALVQRRPIRCSHVYTYHNEGFQPGGGLCLFTPGEGGGRLEKLVDSPKGQILNADVSWDGQEILFSWRQAQNLPYQIFRIRADGTALTQITRGDHYNFDACWLPDGGIAFLSTRKAQVAYCWTSFVGILHRMDRDGANVKQLSGNYLNDFTPCVTLDGRILYSRWEYVDRPAGVIHGLWFLRPDGTDLSVFYGNRVLNPCTFMEPQPIPGTRKILCTLTSHNGELGGAVGILDADYGNNAQASIRNLTPEIRIGRVDHMDVKYGPRGPYERPFPIDGEFFLVSKAGTILLRDYAGTMHVEVLKPRDGIGFYSPQPLRARPRPPVIPSSLPAEAEPWATLVLQDVYNGLEPHVKRGEVKKLCVVQEIEKGEIAPLSHHPEFGYQFPVVSCGATYSPKKVWGYVPVEEDGSACFRVPARVPLYFMAIDAQGRAVQRMRSFTHLMPGEVQGCVGCHEDRQSSSRVRQVAAAPRGPVRAIEPPEWGVRGFDYSQIVQPVLNRHCVVCHRSPSAPKGLDLTGDKTDYFSVSYEHLARDGNFNNKYTKWISTLNGQELNILEITPKAWGSPASRLAEVILSGHPDQDGRPRVRMDEAGRQRIFAWIDLNVPYYGTSLSANHRLPGCRRAYPPDLDRTLQEVGQTRCVSCHSAKGRDGKPVARIPRKKPWVRITEPALNDFLLAPLAKSAGGAEACGRAVFTGTDDPDYRRILQTFDAAKKLLTDPPRGDLPGAKGCAGTSGP
jgi:RNA polymerase sigma factor (sigma-70 family)